MNKSNLVFDSENRVKAQAFFSGDKGHAGAKVTINEAREAINKEFENFSKFVVYTRAGEALDPEGNQYPAINVTFGEAVKDYFGTDKDTFLRSLGIFKKQMNLQEIAYTLGVKDPLSKIQFMSLLKQHSAHQFANAANNYPSTFNFLIPELIMDPIRVGYEGGGFHQNWIAGEESTGGRTNKISIPYIIMGGNAAKTVAEGGSVQFRTMDMAQKDRTTFKVGSGIKMSYELVKYSKVSLLERGLQKVGIDIGISADAYLQTILINGDVTGGGESAPVIGVINTGTGFTSKDIRRVTTRMKRLGYNADTMITGETDGLDIMDIPEFRGYAGDKTQTNVAAQMLGLPPAMRVDAFKMPTSQIMILSKNDAAIKITGSGLMIEDDKDITNQTVLAVATDSLTFAILNRDARVIIDKSVAFVAGTGTDFPSWMDVDANTTSFAV